MRMRGKGKNMTILTMEKIEKSYGARKLLDGADFYLQEGEKVGLIGINGTGKSTLLRIIAGLEEADEGHIARANHLVVGYLPQTPIFDPEDTAIQAVKKQALSQLGKEGAAEDSGERERRITTDAKNMLTRLGVGDFDQKCRELSGGQRKRLALVAVLLTPADVLVLDEPTNHLDSAMAEWLEKVLKKTRSAIVMVTHDRYFLDSVSNRIAEIDKGQIYSYDANYSGYLARKAEREDMAEASQRKRESILRVELEWVKRGARARSTKQKARLERYEELKSVAAPVKDASVELSSAASRLGRTTVELKEIFKSYGERILIRDYTYIFLKNDRVGFVGPNGCGKSTLLKMIAGLERPDSGTITLGQTVKLGYYAQEIGNEMMDPKQRLIDYIRDTAEYVDTAEGKISASGMLERFLFSGEDQYGLLGKLSGGERRRLYLCKVLMDSPNVLLLDEPTNDLDIATLRILERYLDDFPGIVITVSHDRYFLDRVARRIFAFEENGSLRQYEGGYTDYINRKEMLDDLSPEPRGKKGQAASAEEKNRRKSGRLKKLKFSYQEQKEYETIESQMECLEAKITELDAEIPQYSRDFVKLNALMEKKQECEKLLEEKMERWMYLEDLAARIAAGEEAEE